MRLNRNQMNEVFCCCCCCQYLFFCCLFYFFIYLLFFCCFNVTIKGADIERIVVDLYNEIRSRPLFRNVTILYIIENMTGNDHNWIHSIITKTNALTNVFVLSERPKLKLGFCTTKKAKQNAYYLLKTYLAVDGLKFYNSMIVLYDESASFMREMLTREIENVKIHSKTTTGGVVSTLITGILDADSNRLPLNDDLLMAIVLCLLNANRFNNRELEDCPYGDIGALRRQIRHRDEQPSYIAKNTQAGLKLLEQHVADRNAMGLFHTRTK